MLEEQIVTNAFAVSEQLTDKRSTVYSGPLAQGIISVGGLKVISLVLSFLASLLLGRTLGPIGYGQYAFIIACVSILALPIGPGLGQLVTREIARHHHSEEWSLFRGVLRRSYQWVLLGSLFFICVVFLSLFSKFTWVNDDRWTLLFIGILLLPFHALNLLRRHTLQGLRHVVAAQTPELLVRPAFHVCFAFLLFVAGVLTPATALIAQIAATGLAFLLGTYLLRQMMPEQVGLVSPEFRDREWGRALLPFTLLAAISTLNNQVGILATGWLGTDEEVGAMRVAQQGGMLVVLSLTVVNLVIGPYITRAFREGDSERLQQLSRLSVRAGLVMAAPLAVAFIFFGSPILSFSYGEDYAKIAKWPLLILSLGQLINVGFGPVGMLLTMSEYEGETLTGHAVGLSANTLACVVLIPPLGAAGAAIGVTTGLICWNVMLAVKCKSRLGFWPNAV